jgi:hypothetical protein
MRGSIISDGGSGHDTSITAPAPASIKKMSQSRHATEKQDGSTMDSSQQNLIAVMKASPPTFQYFSTYDFPFRKNGDTVHYDWKILVSSRWV